MDAVARWRGNLQGETDGVAIYRAMPMPGEARSHSHGAPVSSSARTVRFVICDGDLRPFERLAGTSRMSSMIELLLWSVAATAFFCAVAFLGAKLLPPYLVHE